MRTPENIIELDDKQKSLVKCISESAQEMLEVLQKNMLGAGEPTAEISVHELIAFNGGLLTLLCSAIIGTLNSAVINAGGKLDISHFITYLTESVKDDMGIAKEIKKTPKNMNKMDKNRIITF